MQSVCILKALIFEFAVDIYSHNAKRKEKKVFVAYIKERIKSKKL